MSAADRSAAAVKANASRTPEQRSAASRKAWDTIRRKRKQQAIYQHVLELTHAVGDIDNANDAAAFREVAEHVARLEVVVQALKGVRWRREERRADGCRGALRGGLVALPHRPIPR